MTILKAYEIACGHGRAVVQALNAEDALNEAYWNFGHRAQPKVIGLADAAAIARFCESGKPMARYSPLPAAAPLVA